MRNAALLLTLTLVLATACAAAQQNPQGAGGNSAPAAADEAGNELLRQQIERTFAGDPALHGSHIVVKVTDSEIALSGMVPTPREKQTAHRIAQSYGNNRRVVDSDLNVQSRTGSSARPR